MNKLAKIGVALCVGSVAAVVGVEVALRAFPGLMPEKARLKLHWRELLVDNDLRSDADPKLGFRFKPSTTDSYDLKDAGFEYTTDEHGFRNPSPWPETAEIVVIGDSLAFGFGAPDDAQWAQIVREGLGGSRLINLALPGYCPAQYEASYHEYGKALAPKLLIVGLFPTNDVRDQPKFVRWREDGAEGNFDVVRFGGGGKKDFLKRFHLTYFLEEYQASRNRGYESVHVTVGGDPLTLVPSQINTSAGVSRRGTPEFQAVTQTLADIHVAAREANTAVLVLLFPCKEEVYLPSLGIDTPQPTAPWAELCGERNWKYLDLTPVLTAAAGLEAGAEEARRLYFEVDGHPNVDGNAVIADAVLEWIRANAPDLAR